MPFRNVVFGIVKNVNQRDEDNRLMSVWRLCSSREDAGRKDGLRSCVRRVV
jgi:hypothetical protein